MPLRAAEHFLTKMKTERPLFGRPPLQKKAHAGLTFLRRLLERRRC